MKFSLITRQRNRYLMTKDIVELNLVKKFSNSNQKYPNAIADSLTQLQAKT
jgi:hypothetical protein